MIERLDRLSPRQCDAVRDLLAAEEHDSGRRPLDEVNRLALAGADALTREHWLMSDPDPVAYAVVSPAGAAELAARDVAAATVLLEQVRESHRGGVLWTHGDRSAGNAAAQALGLPCTRELLLLARDLPLEHPERPLPDGVTRRAFRHGVDDEDWLELNARAFADLPDQASWDVGDLALRVSAPWFDPTDFHIARGPDGSMAGFHWTKIDPDATADGSVSGEVFVIAVDPRWRGTGLGAALLDHGLQHLADRGMPQAHLFVDADNTPAVGFYEAAGFHRVDVDRQYQL